MMVFLIKWQSRYLNSEFIDSMKHVKICRPDFGQVCSRVSAFYSNKIDRTIEA